MGPYFQTRKAFRQGDLLSPILFNIVADMLAIILARAKEGGQIKSVIPHLVDDGSSILQYADDTIIFMDHDLVQAKNMKLLLCAFKQLSGLKIHFHKSEIFCFGQAKEFESTYSHLFGCKTGTFSFRYLGIPMHYRKLRNTDWRMVEERFEKRLGGWKRKLLSVGGRLVLINTVLSSLSMFMLSFFEVPRGVLKRMDYFRSRFFGRMISTKRNTGLPNGRFFANQKTKEDWKSLTLIFKIELLRNKYLRNNTLSQVERKPRDSHFWSSLMGVINLNLQEGNDYFKWHLHKSGIFSVRSMYRYLVNNGVKVSMEIWQTKLPLKIKIFLWYLKKGVSLTKDNLGRRNWHGDKSYCFCGTSETIQHLFLDCCYAKFLWHTRDYAGHFGSQKTKLFLTNANQNLSCRCYSEEHNDFVFGPNCSEVNGLSNVFSKLAAA
ncbi:hypothetical protein U9M48_023298 [Paspalum notatum var. saurae]|uniref:Reverse transcriptase domain-containing protein n=1 Tax=Paspalum notatum var. saurae TaxID=547442 RepID=A0AAQ3TNS4_PASNO